MCIVFYLHCSQTFWSTLMSKSWFLNYKKQLTSECNNLKVKDLAWQLRWSLRCPWHSAWLCHLFQQVMVPTVRSLPPIWETHNEFLASGFDLVRCHLLSEEADGIFCPPLPDSQQTKKKQKQSQKPRVNQWIEESYLSLSLFLSIFSWLCRHINPKTVGWKVLGPFCGEPLTDGGTDMRVPMYTGMLPLHTSPVKLYTFYVFTKSFISTLSQ